MSLMMWGAMEKYVRLILAQNLTLCYLFIIQYIDFHEIGLYPLQYNRQMYIKEINMNNPIFKYWNFIIILLIRKEKKCIRESLLSISFQSLIINVATYLPSF